MELTPQELKEKCDDIGFTQKFMSEALGIDEGSLQKMENGERPISEGISNYAMCLNLLNENELLRKHLKNIGVDLKEKE